MATAAESPEPETPPSTVHHSTITTTQPQTLDVKPFIDYAVGQALFYQKTFNDAVESAIDASTSRFSQIRSTSLAHFQQTLYYLDDFKSQYNSYEDILFGKIKEGMHVAASHPVITCGVTASMGLLVLKRPRRILYNNAKRLFVSEESLVSKATAEVKELRQSIDLLKAEVERMEKSALHAEEQFLHGRTKLRPTDRNQHPNSCTSSTSSPRRQNSDRYGCCLCTQEEGKDPVWFWGTSASISFQSPSVPSPMFLLDGFNDSIWSIVIGFFNAIWSTVNSFCDCDNFG